MTAVSMVVTTANLKNHDLVVASDGTCCMGVRWETGGEDEEPICCYRQCEGSKDGANRHLTHATRSAASHCS